MSVLSCGVLLGLISYHNAVELTDVRLKYMEDLKIIF